MNRFSLLAAALLAALPSLAAAQTVTGTVVDQQGGGVVGGALVRLVGSDGRTRAQALANSAGEFTLRAPAPGRYILRAERVGYASTSSPPLELASGQTVTYRLAAPNQRVQLQGLVANADTRRCTVRPGAGDETSALWDEARKALESAVQTHQQFPYRFRTQRRVRQLDAETGTVANEEIHPTEGFSNNPFVAESPTLLATRGYVEERGDSVLFHAPDANVLLSDGFLEAHCFRAQRADGDHRGMVGLAFEPVEGRTLPEVKGVLWMDAESAELRQVDYHYVNYAAADAAGIGGRVEFRRLPNGTWIVPRWRILMPVVGAPPPATVPSSGIPSVASQRARRQALGEERGEVVEVRAPDGSEIQMVAFASIRGIVYDSTRGQPLANARVSLAGTTETTQSDSAGHFTLPRLAEGVYLLRFSHPRLDSLHFAPNPVRVSVLPPNQLQQDLSIPSMPSLLAAGCNVQPGSAVGVVAGVVSASGEVVSGVPVMAQWSVPGAAEPGRAAAVSDEMGAYRFCELPAGVAVRVMAKAESDSVAAEVHPRQGIPLQQDLAFTSGSSAALSLQMAGAPVRVMGRLVDDATSRPIAGARVSFGDMAPEQTTNRGGQFEIASLQPGSYAIEFSHPQYGTGTSRMLVRGRGTVEFELRIPRRTVTLAPLNVTARRVYPGDFNIRARGRTLNLVSREQIELRLGAAKHVGDLLRTVPGLQIREIQYAGSSSIKEVCVLDRSALSSYSGGSTTSSTGVFSPMSPSQINADHVSLHESVNVVEECHGAQVVLDDVLIGGDAGEFLRNFPINTLESVIYLKPGDAMGRYGSTGQHGLVLLYTRGNGPTAQRP